MNALNVNSDRSLNLNNANNSRSELGLYLYCAGDLSVETKLDANGLDGNKVQVLNYKDLCVVVHNCCLEPYNSDDEVVIKNWVLAHENVIEAAWGEFGVVLPFSFNTIIKCDDSAGAPERLSGWLASEYPRLRSVLDKLRDKAEYVIQVFWDPWKVVGDKLVELTTELAAAEKEILADSKTKGTAYMKKQKLESALRREKALLEEAFSTKFYNQIKKHTEFVCIDKVRKMADREMLLNFACLVNDSQVKELGLELDGIDHLDNFSVRFVGPWPPYSFVGKEMKLGK